MQKYSLQSRYKAVTKKDIINGETVFLREDISKGVIKPYKHTFLGRTRIGICETVPTSSTLHKWVYCSDLCK